jgi:hypothetical protein
LGKKETNAKFFENFLGRNNIDQVGIDGKIKDVERIQMWSYFEL